MGTEIADSLSERMTEDMKHQNIILLGASGVGKSRISKSIVSGDAKIRRVEVDAEIGKNERMISLLEGIEGKDEAARMGSFFGKPWEDPDAYREKQEHYLSIEREEMRRLLTVMTDGEGPVIADLTGSAIYCPDELKELLPHGLAVYLKVGKTRMEEMTEKYLEKPKPVIWGNILERWQDIVRQGNGIEKLPDLYRELLKSRARQYALFADVSIPWNEHRKVKKSADPEKIYRVIAWNLLRKKNLE